MTRTNAHTILCVMIRAFAAWGAVQLLLQLIMLLQMPPQAYADWPLWTRWSAWLLSIALLAMMWLFPDWLARVALLRRTHETFESDIDARDLLAIALATVGAVIAVDAVVDITRTLMFYVDALQEARDSGTSLPPSLGMLLGPEIVGLVASLGLLLGARGIASVIHRVRHASLVPAVPEDSHVKPDES